MSKRQNFGKIKYDWSKDMPDLLDIQKNSFNWFINKGIQEAIEGTFPIASENKKLSLTCGNIKFEDTGMSIDECLAKNKTFEFAMTADFTLNIEDEETGEIIVREDKDLFFGKVPFMTPSGSFVINGAERVIVSQLVRSPGAYFEAELNPGTGRHIYKSYIWPSRGARLEYLSEAKASDSNVIRVVIGKSTKKLTATRFFTALGIDRSFTDSVFSTSELYTNSRAKDITDLAKETGNPDFDDANEEQYRALIKVWQQIKPGEPATEKGARQLIKNNFFERTKYNLDAAGRNKINQKLSVCERITWKTLAEDIVAKDGTKLFKKGTEMSIKAINELRDHLVAGNVETTLIPHDFNLIERRKFIQTVNYENGKTFQKVGSELTPKVISEFKELIEKGLIADVKVDPSLSDYEFVYALENQQIVDEANCQTFNEVIAVKVFPSVESEEKAEYVTVIGVDESHLVKELNIADIFAAFAYEINFADGLGSIDDIDHLGNRRVKHIGELLQNQFNIGLSRILKNTKEKMSTSDYDSITPRKLINSKPLESALKEFFNSSQLSQFMDQTNPLSSLTNKRRLSALGPNGLRRDTKQFEVRDVHYSHYGRVCPIETPEGPNIGLITTLASFGEVNELGFITTPYRVVKDGVATNEIKRLTAFEELTKIIAGSNIELDKDGKIVDKEVVARFHGQNINISSKDVHFMDVSPKQVVSVSTTCIPFLENDDANRALMGANMQRQAVPLLRPNSAIVGTGMEEKIAKDSGVCVLAKVSGTVTYVDALRIVIDSKDGEVEHEVKKYRRTNQGTTNDQRPIVKLGDKVNKGDVIADGMSVQDGELALGQNVTVAFMTWNGYNYEDAIIMSERLVKDDVFTSIHIEEYSIECSDTKLGPEEITRDIPNTSDAARKNLDAEGIVMVGTEVKEGDILVGKITPRGQQNQTPEDRLLEAIFGEKSRKTKDSSLRVPHGADGVVHHIQRISRDDGVDLPKDVNEIIKVFIVQKRKISEGDKMAGRHGNKGIISRILPESDMPYLEDGTPVDIMLNPLGVPSRMNIGQVLELHLGMAAKQLGMKVATPVFDGATNEEILELMSQAKMPGTGKYTLVDGRTGEKFDHEVAVGIMHMIKLAHMVDDKLHARSVGPYSLITQQPLGGKAQKGGQRFGEMEVWALEAYGASYLLQEMITLKSDDMEGRVKMYEAIIKGSKESTDSTLPLIPEPSLPESFNVLRHELQGLGVNVHLLDESDNELADE